MNKRLLLLSLTLGCRLAQAQPAVQTQTAPGRAPSESPIGIFESSIDIGNPRIAGSATYDESTQTYTIKGGGSNIWFNRDEFHFLYKKLKGDFVLTADFAFTGDTSGSVGHRKIGWMIRESTDEGAASANACKHIDGLVVLQWRPYRGMYMRDPEEERFYPKKGGQTIQLTRIGKTITMKIAQPGEPLQTVGSYETETLDKDVLAGLYICSHDSNALATARVWNVSIVKPILHPYSSNPHAAKTPAPEPMAGHPETITIPTYTAAIAPHSAAATTKYTYYSSNATGTTQIWRMRPDGSAKEQLTFDECHSWFPHVSPDGKWLAYVSFPMDIDPDEPPAYDEATLRIMPLASPGAPRVIAYLYGGKNTLNESCWSADSKRLTFIH